MTRYYSWPTATQLVPHKPARPTGRQIGIGLAARQARARRIALGMVGKAQERGVPALAAGRGVPALAYWWLVRRNLPFEWFY